MSTLDRIRGYLEARPRLVRALVNILDENETELATRIADAFEDD